MKPPVYSDSRIKAILMDVDGTMYDASALRRRMLVNMCREFLPRPLEGWRTVRILSAYRKAQEKLRRLKAPQLNCEDLQLEIACRQTGYDAAVVVDCVRRWMQEAPLHCLPLCADPALQDLLDYAHNSGIRLAACSDYPARSKLEALGISRFFDCVVCARDPGVGRFKPHPRMLEVALEALQVSASEALFVGDRPEVDGAAAGNASIPYVNIVHRERDRSSSSATFRELVIALQSPSALRIR